MAAGKKENRNPDHRIRPVAYIHTDFPTKFGIPRQSGLTGDLEAKIVFEPEFPARRQYGGSKSSPTSG